MLEEFNLFATSNGFEVYGNWDSYVVRQYEDYWCIPTGYEILLRAKGIKGINSYEFQKKVDCGKDNNNLKTVGEKVQKEYPDINLGYEQFLIHEGRTGKDKLNEIERLFKDKIFILVSVPVIVHTAHDNPNIKGIEILEPKLGSHIMPIIAMNESHLILFDHMNKEGINILKLFRRDTLEWLHDKISGADDIAYLTD
jgi:hypothetical protein